MEGTLFNDELEELSSEINPAWVSDRLPKLPKNDELQFYMVLGEKATVSFEKSNFEQLPPQKVSGSSNANLGNWQASSSFAKAVSFWAWTARRAPELLKEEAYVISFKFKVSRFVAQHKALQLGHTVALDFRGADCQLCFWGKQQASQQQPLFGSLHIQLGDIIVKLAAFDKMPQLYDSASFDWGGVSNEHHLAAYWKLDLQQHAAVYQQLADKLGPNHPMAKVIQNELAKEVEEPASKMPRASSAAASFWKATAKSFNRVFGEVVQHAEKLTDEQEEEAGTEMFQQQPLQQRKLQDALMAALPACRVAKATFRCT